jgi:hypothetical protein
MRNYCKAYHLKDVRQFPSWSEAQQEGDDLTDDSIVYLWDDFTVVKSPVLAEQGILWQNVTPEWQAFCKETLNFEIPEDLRYVYVQEEQEARGQDKEVSEKSVSSGEGA